MYNYEYVNLIVDLIKKCDETQKDVIAELAVKVADNIMNDKVIHAFGTGHSHMIGIELFARAGGLANVNAMLDPDSLTAFGARRSGAMEKVCGVADVIYDSYNIQQGDIMIIISNSGRNAVPVEMAMRAKKEGIFTVALTNLKQSQETTSRHPSGKKLYECVDCIVDNCVPEGDALMEVAGVKTGPGSSISSMLILNTIVNEALKIVAEKGGKLPVFQSQNVDGFDNDSLYEHYESRVKHY